MNAMPKTKAASAYIDIASMRRRTDKTANRTSKSEASSMALDAGNAMTVVV